MDAFMPLRIDEVGVGMQDVEKLRNEFAQENYKEVEFLAYGIYKWAEQLNQSQKSWR